MNYVIVPDPECHVHVPQSRPLRIWNWLLGRKRPRFVWCPPQTNRLICHPSTVPWLKRWLEHRGHKYTQEAPMLKSAEVQP